ncbi:FG-GAP repeat domain-containing protein [Sorangium cellulosum]|uniref:FG-GAP repeat domain-containing protein n=1 Tax=Sorangium cellulosum TaxID=56 RepID=UPI0009B90558|nr:VCBS repeat-containing protein [Sorangium cellulosum]
MVDIMGMRWSTVVFGAEVGWIACIGLLVGCGKILGLNEFVDAPGGTVASSSGVTTSGGGSGLGEPPTVPVLRLPRNDAYLGAQRKTGSNRPRFVWEASTSPSGASIEYELQYSASPDFIDAVSSTTEFTEYQPDEDLAIALLPPVGRRYYWRVRACAQGACSEFSRAWWVNVGRTKCDYNADGYDDVAISAYGRSPTSSAIYFYFGIPGARFGSEDDGIVFSPFGANDGFGISLSCAGDVDGDGYADVLVGAPYRDTAFVYRGSSSNRFGSDYVRIDGNSVEGMLGPYMASAGDVNGDGFADVIVGTSERSVLIASLYLGGPDDLDAPINLELGEPVEDLGNAISFVSSAGDTNGDGFSDVVVVFHTVDRDIVRLYHGNPGRGFDSAPAIELVDPSGHTKFVSSFDAAGDINGDGFGDVIIGARESNRAYIYLGGSRGLEPTPSLTLVGNESFGATVAAVGDVNGDGFDDVAVADRSPKVLLYLGDGELGVEEPSAAIYGDAVEDRTGQRLGTPGDVNGDGYSDFFVAATEENVVHFYYGRSVVMSPLTEDVSIAQPSGDREFGFAVAHR